MDDSKGIRYEIERSGARLTTHVMFDIGNNPELVGLFAAECAVLSGLRHPKLPKLSHFEVMDNTCSMEIMAPPFQQLSEVLAENSNLSVELVESWSEQLLDVLSFLHEQTPFPLMHLNINAQSLLLDIRTQEIMFRDFGIPRSALFAQHPTNSIRYGPVNDIKSFGELLQELVLRVEGCPEYLKTILQDIEDGKSDRRSASELLDLLIKQGITRNRHGRILCPNCGYPNSEGARFCDRCCRPMLAELTGVDVGLGDQKKQGPNKTSLVEVIYDPEPATRIVEQYSRQRMVSWDRFVLHDRLNELWADRGFDELISTASLPNVFPLPYQTNAALKVLQGMRGRALLADEVGLGKTIEAAIVMKELMVRNLASRVVIFCPPQLQEQWQGELSEKFNETFLILGRDIDSLLAWYCPRLIASYDVLKQWSYAEESIGILHDLVILDEVHMLNEDRWLQVLEIIKKLQKKYFIMLSATPMHNNLDELYNIITLLRPGHFADLKEFMNKYSDPESETKTKNTSELRQLLNQVMIRTSRKTARNYYDLPGRIAQSIPIDLHADAKEIYEILQRAYLEVQVAELDKSTMLKAAELVQRACSSPDAFLGYYNRQRRSLPREAQAHFDLVACNEVGLSALVKPKVDFVKEWLKKQKNQKVLVFSSFNETARYLFKACRGEIDNCLFYDEESTLDEKSEILRMFARPNPGVLFCPGEASIGLNLQHTRIMINFDLPWDPMKIEQRIGRIQRIRKKGHMLNQDSVIIINVYLEGTIEYEIIDICERKLCMFNAVVGKTEPIIGKRLKDFKSEDIYQDIEGAAMDTVCNLEEDISFLIGQVFSELYENEKVNVNMESLSLENDSIAADDFNSEFLEEAEDSVDQSNRLSRRELLNTSLEKAKEKQHSPWGKLMEGGLDNLIAEEIDEFA